MMAEDVSRTFQARRALLAHLAPRYQQASLAQKTLLLNAFVAWTGYTRKYAIELLNHGEPGQQTIQRHRLPQYGPAVQQALFLTWKAAHYVCAKRLLPSLPTLVTLLERHGHLCLTEEERRQLLTMSLSTAERYLRTQRKPRLHGLSTTTPGPWGKAQVSVCSFSPWEEHRPGFVEMDLVAHCGDHLDGDFLYTLTLTDLATGWTECVPLLLKSAEAVLSALEEVCRLRLADVDLTQRTVTVRGTGGDLRTFPCQRTGSTSWASTWSRPVSRQPGSRWCQRHEINSCSPNGGIHSPRIA